MDLIQELATQNKRIFTIDEFRLIASEHNVSKSYINHKVNSLMRKGLISPIKRGLYALDDIFLKGHPIQEYEIAMYLVSPAIISYSSALNLHRLSEQIPKKIMVTTFVTSAIPQSGKFSDFFHFVKAHKEHIYGTMELAISTQASVTVTDQEKTIIDCLYRPMFCGGFQEILSILSDNFDLLNLDKLIDYAIKMDKATVKRLGWILDNVLNLPDNKLQKLLDIPIVGYARLNAHAPLLGRCNKKWMIKENITL